jgi:hypothetical protein
MTNNRWMTVKAENRTGKVKFAVIFGCVMDLTDQKNSNAGVEVTVEESSHLQVKVEILSSSIMIFGLEIIASGVSQFKKPFEFIKFPHGQNFDKEVYSVKRFQLEYEASILKEQCKIIVPEFNIFVTPFDFIRVKLNPYSWMQFKFHVIESRYKPL